MSLWERLFGKTKSAATSSAVGAVHLGLQDPRLPQAVEALMSNVSISRGANIVKDTGAAGSVMRAATLFEDLHKAYPDSPELHFAWAAALQVALQGETASKVLNDCSQAHPHFWLASAMLKQNALHTWNPFFMPAFAAKSDSQQVHPMIERTVQTNILLATRKGVLPRAVFFLLDARGDLPVAKLKSCPIEFATTISATRNPLVVAINGRIHDNPTAAYECEELLCPNQPFGSDARLTTELFVRQETFDFVILEQGGRVKYTREIRPSPRMKAAHKTVAEMLEKIEGPKLSTDELVSAIKRYQATVDPKKITY